MNWLWMVSLAVADPKPIVRVSLEHELESQVLEQLKSLNDVQKRTALASFEATVFPSARVHYELGLEYNQLGKLSLAEEQYRESLEVDKLYIPALYDLAELLLLRGDVIEAKQHLHTIQDQDNAHWVVSYRLAQIAASELATQQMESNLKQALRAGMPIQILLDDKAQWQKYVLADEVALSMELLLSALGHESIWKRLQSK